MGQGMLWRQGRVRACYGDSGGFEYVLEVSELTSLADFLWSERRRQLVVELRFRN